MEFPKMIYLGGEHGAEHRIVADQAEQNAAKADGYLQLPAEPPPVGDEKTELFAALTDAGIKFDKRWNVEKLRAALEGKPE
ncbi:hypothetical protein D3C81_170240 [compost metagenome]